MGSFQSRLEAAPTGLLLVICYLLSEDRVGSASTPHALCLRRHPQKFFPFFGSNTFH